MWEKRPSVKGGKGRYVFIGTNHSAKRAANRKQGFPPTVKQLLPFDPDILRCAIANQQAFGNRNYWPC